MEWYLVKHKDNFTLPYLFDAMIIFSLYYALENKRPVHVIGSILNMAAGRNLRISVIQCHFDAMTKH
jgi:lipid-A-disaccharide synthase-like uncharacterized protein